MFFKLMSLCSLVVVMAVAMASADAYELWYKNKGSSKTLKKNIAGGKIDRFAEYPLLAVEHAF